MKYPRNSKLLIIIEVLVFLGLPTSCAPNYRMTKCSSYVVCYIHLDSLKLSVDPSNSQCILINAISDFSKTFGLHSSGVDKEMYDKLCHKHKDISYNQYRLIGSTLDIESVTYNDCDFSEIRITSDKDFDAMHPAGSDLSDIVRFMSWSPFKFITSGYTKFYHYERTTLSDAFDTLMRIYSKRELFDQTNNSTCYPVDKLIKDISADDLILLGGDDALALLGMLYFDKIPNQKGRYQITVIFKTDENKTFSDTISLQF